MIDFPRGCWRKGAPSKGRGSYAFQIQCQKIQGITLGGTQSGTLRDVHILCFALEFSLKSLSYRKPLECSASLLSRRTLISSKGHRVAMVKLRKHKGMSEVGEVMAPTVVCEWIDSNYTTKGPPGWGQPNWNNYVCQCGFSLLISFRAGAYEQIIGGSFMGRRGQPGRGTVTLGETELIGWCLTADDASARRHDELIKGEGMCSCS